MVAAAIAWSVLLAVAYAVLTGAGVLLWRRARTVATAMVVVGFAILFLDELLLLIGVLQTIARFYGHPSGDTLFLVFHRANSLYVHLLGVWFAAIGLLWHASQGSRR